MLNFATHLSDEQFEALSDLLDDHAAFDINGVLGLMHAIAVGPAKVLPSVWLPLMALNRSTSLGASAVRDLQDLILCLYNEVVDYVEHEEVVIPAPDDVDGCEAFAVGYIAGAELAREWTARDDRWSLAAPFAYLAGRLDLIPPKFIADIERQLGPDAKQCIRDQMGSLVLAAKDSFQRQGAAPVLAPSDAAERRARGDEPRPCGSGKTYERCCAISGDVGRYASVGHSRKRSRT